MSPGFHTSSSPTRYQWLSAEQIGAFISRRPVRFSLKPKLKRSLTNSRTIVDRDPTPLTSHSHVQFLHFNMGSTWTRYQNVYSSTCMTSIGLWVFGPCGHYTPLGVSSIWSTNRDPIRLIRFLLERPLLDPLTFACHGALKKQFKLMTATSKKHPVQSSAGLDHDTFVIQVPANPTFDEKKLRDQNRPRFCSFMPHSGCGVAAVGLAGLEGTVIRSC